MSDEQTQTNATECQYELTAVVMREHCYIAITDTLMGTVGRVCFSDEEYAEYKETMKLVDS